MTVTLAWVFGDEDEALEWNLALAVFCPDAFVVLGADVLWRPHRTPFEFSTAATLAEAALESEIVVLAPRNGAVVQGTTPLTHFIHPPNALYLFGSDNAHLDPAVLAGWDAELVYIPTDGDLQLHSYETAMLVMYDRRARGG